MPVIRVDWLSGRSQEQKKEVASVFTRELARIAKCKPDDVQIVFLDVERKDWAVGGVFAADPNPEN
ncbi:tautomerase family protein [Agrobacterium salinitolerans]|uniref:tautomerase family protein n=1 Tax=Agrobacterium salinitolerans TaxID=1183413 RepID=UPI001571E457|nr:tautomerase family protein [Agrobacterium salinitolerans]NTA40656.1 4-oxalocrotonate tautomerase [Agrobacterium salinitolerans]